MRSHLYDFGSINLSGSEYFHYKFTMQHDKLIIVMEHQSYPKIYISKNQAR